MVQTTQKLRAIKGICEYCGQLDTWDLMSNSCTHCGVTRTEIVEGVKLGQQLLNVCFRCGGRIERLAAIQICLEIGNTCNGFSRVVRLCSQCASKYYRPKAGLS